MTWVIGFDLSLKAPAAVALPLDWRPGDWKRVKAWLGEPAAPKDDDLIGQVKRYIAIADWAASCVQALRTAKVSVYVESYGYNKSNKNASRIMESGGVVKAELFRRHQHVTHAVAASSARLVTLGFSPQKPRYDAKAVVQEAVFQKFKAPKAWDENQCDAFLIAQFGLSEEGGTIFTLAKPGKKRT